MRSELAINGGPPVRSKPFAPYNPFGEAEKRALCEVIDSGVLSGFVGGPGEEFLGGPRVRRLEEAWASAFDVGHAVAMNSATSGLQAALAACRIGPGDEVIVPPFTMSATLTAILANNAVPVFADVEADTFNIDPEDVRRRITPHTKAVIVVHLFGHPADMPAIVRLAGEHDLFVIEDNAQSIGAMVDNRYAGTIGDIGVFSLNRHKLIQSGEGAVCVSDDDGLALRLRLVRNHGENLVEALKVEDISHTFGFNFRMTELEAAVAYEQFTRRAEIIGRIVEMSDYLDRGVAGVPGLSTVTVRENCTHTRMHHTLLYDHSVTGVPRDRFVEAVIAEGVPIWGGYLTPHYMLPVFRQQIAYGTTGCPFRCPHYQGELQDFGPGLCPTAEHLHTVMINHDLHRPPNTLADMDDIIAALRMR